MASNILVVGSGGREHALAWKLSQSPRIGKLYVAPGNGGTRDLVENVSIGAKDIKGLARFAEKHSIDLTVVGPDDPLALGVVDVFRSRDLRIFGPTRVAAQLEASKAFAKRLMRDGGIATAPFRIFRKHRNALDYVRRHGAPIVIKKSGLALGKGAYPCEDDQSKAERALAEIMVEQVHGKKGNEVIAEEFLYGEEISIQALCDGKTAILFPPLQDHKPIFDGGKGKNTGGMGTICPVPGVTDCTMRLIDKQIVQATLRAMARRDRPFTGCLFPGLKMTSGGPKVLEFNARFGDPETQSWARLLKTDLLDLLDACVDGRLGQVEVEWSSKFAACVVIVSGGYPGAYRKGIPISGLNEAKQIHGVVVFHAGTSYEDCLVTSGGRVLGVTAVGDTLKQALALAYEAVHLIKFEGMHFRTDIGAKAIAMS
ncbi:MAG: phosphoribosylamine--glycine ligase [Candidatus Vogelbacteria bacterium]|nr:phosphoribosylamine--glycine ligase [Candidatus Vogelbacteria bacterium]